MTPPPAASGPRPAILCGDCRELLPGLEEPVAAVVTDPPYGLEFMGQGWDRGVPGVDFWKVISDAMLPGAHLLAFGGTRTFHRLTCAIEDAGFEIRDCLMWVYGSGFPKSLDVSKAIDKAAGAEREVVGPRTYADGTVGSWRRASSTKYAQDDWTTDGSDRPKVETAPATAVAKQWEGWGTALKPAWEPIILARKPLIGTVAENVQQYGTGALNIDACRVGGVKPDTTRGPGGQHGITSPRGGQGRILDDGQGRWPANLMHDGSDEVLALFPETVGQQGEVTGAEPSDTQGGFVKHKHRFPTQPRGDTGSAARFFYCAKASSTGRGNETKPARPLFGIEEETFRNEHPTVKPVELMRYLCRLVTPPGGTVLDPFAGSGSTLIAARAEGFRSIGIELEKRYCEMAERRIQNP